MNLLLPRLQGAAAACCLLLLLPATALGANGEGTPLGLDQAAAPAARTAQAAPGGGGGGLVRTIVGLAVVLGVIYGLHWVLKQVKASKDERQSGAGLGTLATLPLGPNRSLHLIRAGAELVLVGAGEHGVTPIRTYSEDEARRLGLLDESSHEDGPTTPSSPASLFTGGGAGGTVGRALETLRARTVLK